MVESVLSQGSTVRPRTRILSIRARLVILALLTLVPLMADRVRLLEQTRTERIGDAASEVLELARRGAEGQRQIIATAKALLQVMARAYVNMQATGSTCNFYLADLAAGMPWVNGMSVIDRDGKVKCSTVQSAIGVDLSDRPHVREALTTREFVISSYLLGRLIGRPAFVAVFPIQAIDRSVEGAVITSVDLQWISALISSLERRAGSSVLLVDGAGTLLAGDPSTAKWLGKRIDDTAFFKALHKGEGTVRIAGLDGVRRVFAYARVPGSDARLAVGLNEADVLARTDRELTLAYLQLGFFGLLVMLLAWFGGERLIVQPIRSLVRTAERFGRGDLEARVPQESWAKEFAPLADALNDMARRLDQRRQELRAANNHLQELASSDALSGLANRRGFDARLAAEWQRAAKLGHSISLLMIDVDYFKLFNDHYGHVEGDVCLRRIGKLLQQATAGGDNVAARYGGEEFVLLLPGADAQVATAVGERLRRAVEELCIAHAASPCGQVTISVGVASLVPGIAEAAEKLIDSADIALYAAKRRGRNAVAVHNPALRQVIARPADDRAA